MFVFVRERTFRRSFMNKTEKYFRRKCFELWNCVPLDLNCSCLHISFFSFDHFCVNKNVHLFGLCCLWNSNHSWVQLISSHLIILPLFYWCYMQAVSQWKCIWQSILETIFMPYILYLYINVFFIAITMWAVLKISVVEPHVVNG